MCFVFFVVKYPWPKAAWCFLIGLRAADAFDEFDVLDAPAFFVLDPVHVKFPDFLVLSGNFNKTSGGATAAAVPEPASVTLLGFAGLLLGSLRRRRR